MVHQTRARLPPVLLQPQPLEPGRLVRLRCVVVPVVSSLVRSQTVTVQTLSPVVDSDLRICREVLQGGHGHDDAQHRVHGEQNELGVGVEAVVDLVGQTGGVAGGVTTQFGREVDTQLLLLLTQVQCNVVPAYRKFLHCKV